MRLQLAINVSDIDEAVDFYSRMFATEPVKTKPGYANFAIANPPLKLVLFEGGEPGSINHLGVETETASEVVEAEQRMSDSGLATTGVDDTVCCYAEKTETWIAAPDELRWEYYVKHADVDEPAMGLAIPTPTTVGAGTTENTASGESETGICCA